MEGRYVGELALTVRRLGRSPMFAAAAVLILTLAMGVGTAMFAVVDAVLLRPLPFEEQPGVFRISWNRNGQEIAGAVLPVEVVEPLLAAEIGGASLAGYSREDLALVSKGRGQIASTEAIAGDYFELVHAVAVAGHLPGPRETAKGNVALAVISEGLRREWLREGVDLLETTVTIGGEPAFVVGIVAPPFQGVAVRGLPTDAWILGSTHVPRHVFGRVHRGVAFARVAGEARARVSLSPRYKGYRLDVVPGLMSPLPGVAYLVGAAALALCGLVVLVAGSSVTILVIARGTVRQAEFATRTMLGASARDISRLILLETGLIVLLAAVLSVPSAALTIVGVSSALRGTNRLAMNLSVDWHLLAYVCSVGLLTMWALSRAVTSQLVDFESPTPFAAQSGSGGSTARSRPARRRLLAIQAGAATLFLTLASALLQGTAAVRRQVDGQGATEAVVAWLDIHSYGLDEAAARSAEAELLGNAGAPSSAGIVGLASDLPVRGRGTMVSVTASDSVKPVRATAVAATARFFPAYGLRLVAGHVFDEATVNGNDLELVVSYTLSAALWPSDQLGGLGHHIDISGLDGAVHRGTVAGIVAPGRAGSASLGDRDPIVFLPPEFISSHSRILMVARGNHEGGGSMDLLRRAATVNGTALALTNPATLADAVASISGIQRGFGLVLTAVGGLAALIAALGLYGVAVEVSRRDARDIGVFLALGATWPAVAGALLRDNVASLVQGGTAGLLAALVCALFVRRYLAALTIGDWYMVAGVPSLWLCAAVFVSILPLLGQMKRSPHDLLRSM